MNVGKAFRDITSELGSSTSGFFCCIRTKGKAGIHNVAEGPEATTMSPHNRQRYELNPYPQTTGAVHQYYTPKHSPEHGKGDYHAYSKPLLFR